MGNGDGDPQQREGAQAALIEPVNESEQQTTPDEQGERPIVASTPRPAGARIHIAPWALAASAALLVGTLLLMLADAQAGHIGAIANVPTAVPSPTATATALPSPTPIEGFQYYADRSNRFLIQYPVGWTTDALNPGIEFTDDSNSPGYIVQVVPASTVTAFGPTDDPSDPSAWVNYELDYLSSRSNLGPLVRLPGSAHPTTGTGTPTPSVPASTPAATATLAPTATPVKSSCGLPERPVSIGGTDWETGGGIFPESSPQVCVQVYATVYQGKPYIINVTTYDDRFTAGDIQFFAPMLSSFEFLPANS